MTVDGLPEGMGRVPPLLGRVEAPPIIEGLQTMMLLPDTLGINMISNPSSLVALIGAACVVALAAFLLCKRRTTNSKMLLVLFACAAALTLVYLTLLVLPGGTGTKAVIHFGKPERQIQIRQEANFSAEPYTTSVVYLDANGKWWSAQLDFQDTRWLGTCELIEDRISGGLRVMRSGLKYAEIRFNPLEAQLEDGNRIAFQPINGEQ